MTWLSNWNKTKGEKEYGFIIGVVAWNLVGTSREDLDLWREVIGKGEATFSTLAEHGEKKNENRLIELYYRLVFLQTQIDGSVGNEN